MAAGVGTDVKRRTAMLAIALAAALVIGGCDPNPSPPASAGAATAGPSGDAANRLVVAITPVVADWSPVITTPFLSFSNLFLPPELPALPRFVHASLYRYDDTLSPVPDLAAEPCSVGDDAVTITCRLADATFHDESAVTAADVVFSFELARHSGCTFTGYLVCLDTLERVRAVDERTVEFTLNTPDATFLTLALPLVMIESQAVVEGQYAPLADAELDRSAMDAMLEEIATVVEGGDAACGPVVAEADGLLEGLGIGVPSHDYFERIDEGGFDACAALHFARYRIEHVLASDEAEGLEAIAAAYGALPLNWEPIGAGPWRIRERIGGHGLLLESAPSHHLGPAATGEIELRLFPANESAAEAMAAGDVDWIPNQFVGLEAVEQVEGARILTYEAPAFAYLAFNLREGRLFADPNIRAALEHCIDKQATVDAATEGGGTAIFSPIEPISWAYRDDLPRVERDVAEAKRLIEESGWKMGTDGTYERDGRRLATDVFVGDFDAPRIRFMDLVAEQARDCGIELTVVPADVATVLEPLDTFPHVPGGYEEPFDAVFLGWIHGWDPSDILFDSRFASSEEQPDGPNVMGYRNPRIDELLDAGIATYDQRERARIYREYQTILAEEHPVLFAWAYRLRDAITAGVRMADGGEINEASGFWWWRLEHLGLADDPT
jgi:ABC-type transport system substrate-binding protein